MKQNQNTTSLWSLIRELVSKTGTLLAKKIGGWIKVIDKELNEDSSAKVHTPAKVADMGESNMANQSKQNYNVDLNNNDPSPPATVINKTSVSLGLGEVLFWV